MFDNITFSSAGRGGGRNNTKTSASHTAMAYNILLGRAPEKGKIRTPSGRIVNWYEMLAFHFAWKQSGCSVDAGQDGMFQFSGREISSHRTTLKSAYAGGNDRFKPSVDDMRRIHAELVAISEGETIPEWTNMHVHFWNEKLPNGDYNPECPNPAREMTLAKAEIESKGSETVCFIRYPKPTDEQIDALRKLIESNIIPADEIENARQSFLDGLIA